MGEIDTKLDKQYEDTPLKDLADAPVAALQGLSEADGEKLEDALGVKTVRDLGTNKYFLWAQAIAKLSE